MSFSIATLNGESLSAALVIDQRVWPVTCASRPAI
jgi:hypothetical protein